MEDAKPKNNSLKGMLLSDLQAIEVKRPDRPFNGFIIVPTGELHDSGWGCMKFVLTHYGEIVGCVGGYSDVVHLNGIGGYGKDFLQGLASGMTAVVDWSIDLLPEAGCVRVFCSQELVLDEWAILSDFDVYTKAKGKV